jgi:hypothetical protein
LDRQHKVLVTEVLVTDFQEVEEVLEILSIEAVAVAELVVPDNQEITGTLTLE